MSKAMGPPLRIVGAVRLALPTDRSGPEQERDREETEAARLGELYCTLKPLCEWNRQSHLLDANLERCKQWAERNGVLDDLEIALRQGSDSAI